MNANENIPIPLIPPTLLDQIEYVYAENDDQIEPTYCFKNGSLECPFYPGYFYIPGFSKYVINRDGDLITVMSGKKRKWTSTRPAKNSIRGGYYAAPVVNDHGQAVSLSRHRAMALTFLGFKKHPKQFVINHKNGMGGDDRVENLEFCTYGENTLHAYKLGLYSNKTTSIDVKNWKTGFEKTFNSIEECALSIGVKSSTIWSKLNRPNSRRFSDGWRFKRTTDDWLELNDREDQRSTDREVIGRNVQTGETVLFGSIAHASRMTGIHAGTLHTHCLTKVKTPFMNWNFRFLDDFSHWPIYTDQQLEIFKEFPTNPRDGVSVLDLETNERYFYVSPEKAGERFERSPITIGKLARYGGVLNKRYLFSFVRIRENY